METEQAGGEYRDYPLEEIAKSVTKYKAMGYLCYQKYTCAGCGARLAIDEPNILYTKGKCDNCPTITNIAKQGCNFLLIARVKP